MSFISNEVQFVGGARLELGYQMTVEVAGVGGFGVHQQTSTANIVREFDEPSQTS